MERRPAEKSTVPQESQPTMSTRNVPVRTSLKAGRGARDKQDACNDADRTPYSGYLTNP